MKITNRNVTTFLVFLMSVFASSQIVQAEQLNQAIDKGKQEFIDSCSLCHGASAKGDGLFASMLTVETADLTKLSKNNDGFFPFREVYLIVDGRESIKQHGPRRMPIWGDRFKSTTWYTVNQDYAETLVSGKIFELLLYLESIQEK